MHGHEQTCEAGYTNTQFSHACVSISNFEAAYVRIEHVACEPHISCESLNVPRHPFPCIYNYRQSTSSNYI